MGEAEWLKTDSVIRIHSDFYFYGEAASVTLAESIAKDIANSLERACGDRGIKKFLLHY